MEEKNNREEYKGLTFIKAYYIYIIQLLLLVVAPVTAFGLFDKSLVSNDYEIGGVYVWKILFSAPMHVGKIIVAFLTFFAVLYLIRKINKNIPMNRGDHYFDFPYFWYCLCSLLLGVESCNLTLVPIHLQIKLVVNSVFHQFNTKDDQSTHLENDVVTINRNQVVGGKVFNIIISDTYDITEEKIPEPLKRLPTICISRVNDKRKRIYCLKLVQEVQGTVHKLPEGSIINVFATTNPSNTRRIAEDVFRSASRSNIAHLYVYQQNGPTDRTFEKRYKIY